MKNITLLLLLISFLSHCQEQNKSNKMNNPKLLDGISIDNNSLFKKEEINLKKYKYNGEYLEDIRINDLLNKEYCDELIKYLTNTENDELVSSLITELLIIRIYQLQDEQAFKILLNLSKNDSISYNGIELHELVFTRILIENPQFFIEQCYKNQDADFLKYIVSLFNQYFVNEEFFELNMGYPECNGGEILLNPQVENTFGHNFKELIKKLPKVRVIFSSSLYTDWENRTLFFTDVSSVFGKQMTDKLSVGATVYYKLYILPELNKYIMQKGETKIDKEYKPINNDEITAFFSRKNAEKYTISDPDGYTNLRKDKSSQSEILQKITAGREIEVLDKTGDWWKVKSKEGKIGYIHKSRIKSSSNSHSSVYKLYDRPDFSSFSRKIAIKGEIEILYNTSGWDFIKVAGTTGYLPTEEAGKEKQETEQLKHSFLADDEPLSKNKKGFWGSLLS
ncbi:SH3 domain-containing protein [Chryseobacterium taichungense]|uniref:SH3 domain-containing protein n=1 Tax=Chryseobacterium taichungense TaxID=295069 RepID=UPI0028A95209|nr:SH3 domain-containing protein [Chryseobacterium taichungense]